MKKIHALIILLLLATSLIARIWQLGSLPPILNRDEAALAYNGYLLSQTGMDEWQQRWPMALESFGDYKLIGYPALLALGLTFFPASDFLVRVPSAVAGLVLPLIIFLLMRKKGWSNLDSTLSAVLVTTTPVLFFYSRVGFEANVGLVLFCLVLLLSWKSTPMKLSKRYFFDFTALFVLALAVSTYNTPLLLAPFLVPLWIFQRGIKNWKSWLPLVIGSCLVLVGFFTHLSSLTLQKSSITIFSDETVWKNSVDYRLQFSGFQQKLFGNQYLYYLKLIVQNLVESLSPTFLLLKGGEHPWHSLPSFGHLLWPVYGLGGIGIAAIMLSTIFQIVKRLKYGDLSRYLIQIRLQKIPVEPELLYLCFVGLLPSIITVDSPHATRSLLFLLMWPLFAVHGFKWLRQWFSSKLLLSGLLLLITVNTFWYYYHYFVIYPTEQSSSYQVGFNEVIIRANTLFPEQPIAVIDRTGFMYVVTAWYTVMPAPVFFETQVKQLPDLLGFRYGERVGNFHFIAQLQDRSEQETVVVIRDEQTEVWEIKNLTTGESL